MEHDDNPTHVYRRRLFSVDEFYYLDVPKVGTVTVFDDFDCTFKCLNNPSCFSVNLAASKEPSGKLWCELLSSDKYSNARHFKKNKSWHHFSMTVESILFHINIPIGHFRVTPRLLPLFQNESSSRTFRMKMSLICM